MSTGTILDEIIIWKKQEVKRRKKRISGTELEKQIPLLPPTYPFGAMLKRENGVALIAEIKKASPSKGVIRDDFEPVFLAKTCEGNGAAALSVLTDECYFQGSPAYLSQVREAVPLPILCKDFIIDEYQIMEARIWGADAVLLIAAVLEKEEIEHLLAVSSSYNLECLVEVHSEADLANVPLSEVNIIGINNRDLCTFTVNLSTTISLCKSIPSGKVIVSESGISTRHDVGLVRKAGVNAILVGESIMRASDVGSKVRELLGA